MDKRKAVRLILLFFLFFFVIYIYLARRSPSPSSRKPSPIKVREESSVSYGGEIVTPTFTLKAEESASFPDRTTSYKNFILTTSIGERKVVITGKEARLTPKGADFSVEMEGNIVAKRGDGLVVRTEFLRYLPETKELYAPSEVWFRGKRFSGEAGAGSYYLKDGVLKLEKGVRIKLRREGVSSPIEVVASAGEFRRKEQRIFLRGGVMVASGDDFVRGERAIFRLLPDSNSLKRMEIWGNEENLAISSLGSSFFKEAFFAKGERKRLSGSAIVVIFDPSGKNLRFLQLLNPASVSFSSSDYGERRLEAKRIEFSFGEGGRLSEVDGYSGTTITISPREGEMIRVICREIRGKADDRGEITGFNLLGGIEVEQGELKGRAKEGRYILKDNRIVLLREAVMNKGDELLSGERIDFFGNSGDFAAFSQVVSRFSSSGELFPGGAKGRKVVVNADTLHYDHIFDRLHYKGLVRVLYDAGILFAKELDIERTAGILIASGDVRARLDQPKTGGKKKKEKGLEGPIRVSGGELFYYREEGKLLIRGDATLSQGELRVKGDEVTLFEDKVRGGWRRGIARGRVRIFYLQDRAEGEEGEYLFFNKILILTGSPAKISRSGEGELAGRRLTLIIGGDKMRAVSRENERVKAVYKEKGRD